MTKTYLYYGPGADADDPGVENDGVELTNLNQIFLAELLAYDTDYIDSDRYICVVREHYNRIIAA